MCRVLGVSPSGFYAARNRPQSQRSQANEALGKRIATIFMDSRATYGSPRVHFELFDQGERLGRKRVERLMRSMGLQARTKRCFHRPTDSNHAFPVAANRLDRQFRVETKDRVWATDITYIRTAEGWLYLAVVVDLFSRRVVGWSMTDHLRTELVRGALEMALGNRLPDGPLLHHSDRGSQYASFEYQKLLQKAGIECRMSRRAECYDNAVVESFFGTIKTELVYHTSWITRRAARLAIHEYIEVFYNLRRRHSYLGYMSPAEFENQSTAACAA